jgi:hypothetical protein
MAKHQRIARSPVFVRRSDDIGDQKRGYRGKALPPQHLGTDLVGHNNCPNFRRGVHISYTL